MDSCPIVVASRRLDGDWNDLKLTVKSVRLYAKNCPLVVAWDGPQAPRFSPEEYGNVMSVRQDETCRTFGSAYNFGISKVDGDCIILNDDVVLLPDSISKLLEDVEELRRIYPVPAGIVGCRGSFASGCQSYDGFVRAQSNFISANAFQRGAGPLIRLEPPHRIAPFAAWLNREAFEQVGGLPDADWFGDDAFGLRLHRAKFSSFVSRSYVFHIGERSSSTAGITQEQLLVEGKKWAETNEPGLLR